MEDRHAARVLYGKNRDLPEVVFYEETFLSKAFEKFSIEGLHKGFCWYKNVLSLLESKFSKRPSKGLVLLEALRGHLETSTYSRGCRLQKLLEADIN